MRKLLYILLFPVIFAFFTSCDDGELKVDDTTLEVLEISRYVFGPEGGNGTMTVDNTGNTVTATSSNDWVTPVVNGNTITFEIPEYYGISSRTAEFTIKSGKLTAKQRITQEPASFRISDQYFNFNETAGNASFTITYPFTGSQYLSVSIDGSWATLSPNNDGTYTITVPANNEKNLRKASLNVIIYDEENGNRELSYPIIQKGTIEYSDFLGSWNMTYTATSGLEMTATVALEQKVNGTSFNAVGFNDEDLPSFVMDYNFVNVIIHNNQYLGIEEIVNEEALYHYLIMTTEGGGYTWSNVATYTAEYEVEGNTLRLTFTDGGTYSDAVITGISVWQSASHTLTGEDLKMRKTTFNNIVLEKTLP